MKKSLSLILYFSLVFSLHAQVTSGLVAYYPFSGNAQDASGNGYHGTTSGGVSLTEDKDGNAASAYDFDGSSGRIDIMEEIPASLLGTNPKTISLWIYPTPGWNVMIYMGTTATIAGGTLRFVTDNNGNLGVDISHGIAYSSIPVDLNQWNFVFLTWDGTNFVVGKGEGESLQTEQLPGLDHHNLIQGTANIGYNPMNDSYAEGTLDEVRIYDRVLNETELLELYIQASLPDLLVYFPFTGNINDESGNNYHGTVSGTVNPASDCSGASASAYEFAGNGYITFFETNSIPEALIGTNTKSIILHFFPTQNTNSLLTLGGNYYSQGGSLRLISDTDGNIGVDVSAGVESSNVRLDLNEWNQIYLCWDGTNFTISKRSESNPGLVSDVINNLSFHNLQQGMGYIGYDPYNESYANGVIDEVRIYDRCLSESELPGFSCGTVTSNIKNVSSLVQIAPNPSSGKFAVQMNRPAEDVEISILNTTGDIVYHEKSAGFTDRKEIQLSAEPGIYFFLIRAGNFVQTEKIILE